MSLLSTLIRGATMLLLARCCEGLVELMLTPQTADDDGAFVQAVLAEGQYEIIRA